MTFTNEDEVHVMPELLPIFWCFVVISSILFYYSLGYAKQYSTTAAFLLTPFLGFCLILDNTIMATNGIDRRRITTQIMLAFHACIVPLLLLVCYELAYLVHKHKCVNFCGILFQSGRDKSLEKTGNQWTSYWFRLSTCLRLMVWILSCILLVLNLLVAYHWTSDLSLEITSFYELQGDHRAHMVSAILPALSLVLLALYIGLQLWNYGTHHSYMVHATCFNPWIWMFIGAMALLIGYLMPSPIYAVSSNAGEVIMMATVVRMFREVHHDMQQGLHLGDFIDPEGAAARRQGLKRFGGHCINWSISKNARASKMTVERCNGYVAATTPNHSELPVTFANQLRRGEYEGDVQPSASDVCVSVVVARERTNSLCKVCEEEEQDVY
ncbi:unnamed protein product [Peronospora belbahrii]|uniref:Uncharacterized protein n=1 Tax=Peronospora belbahrii TaxID=622444 RepID=A0ABN8CUB6_9STRA|nr:unnamed protein product [Peronospora belbahrii]